LQSANYSWFIFGRKFGIHNANILASSGKIFRKSFIKSKKFTLTFCGLLIASHLFPNFFFRNGVMRIKTLFLCFVFSLIVMPGESQILDAFQKLNEEYSEAKNQNCFLPLSFERAFQEKETAICTKLLDSKDALISIAKNSSRIESGLLSRLIERIRFKINHENRNDLKDVLEMFPFHQQLPDIIETQLQKLGSENSRHLDLQHGEWKTSPDGKKFWVSSEDPEVILTPAEFQRKLSSH